MDVEILSPNPIKNFERSKLNYERKNNQKTIWINQEEDNLLKAKAKKTGLNESEFLRSCIKGYKIKEQPTEEIREFTKQISGVANNINQIAMRVNIRGYAGTDELDYLRNTINQFIIEFQKKIYSRE